MADNALSSFIGLQNPQIILAAALTAVIGYLPRLLAAVLIFLLGKLVAGYLADGVAKIIDAINLKKVVDSFKLGITFPQTSQQGISKMISLLIRYLVLYFTLVLMFDILGLSGIALFLRNLAAFLPKLISALVVVLLGVILAGFIESLVKRTLSDLDPAAARLTGKIASYIVVCFFILISLAELGIASFLINTLFIGFVAATSLAVGLSVGLGSKDVVAKTLEKWLNLRNSKKK